MASRAWISQITFPVLPRHEWNRFQDMKELHNLQHHHMLPLLLTCAQWMEAHQSALFQSFVAQVKE